MFNHKYKYKNISSNRDSGWNILTQPNFTLQSGQNKVIARMTSSINQLYTIERSRISRKRYEIERKCEQKLDRKSYMDFRMVEIFLTSGDP